MPPLLLGLHGATSQRWCVHSEPARPAREAAGSVARPPWFTSCITVTRAPRLGARIIAAGLALQFAFGLVYSWSAVAPHARDDGWPALLVGAVFSATPVGYGTGMIAAGWLADRYPPRRLCAVAVGLMAAGFAVTFARPGPVTFIIFYGWLALGVGGALALGGALAAGTSVFASRAGAVGGSLTAAYALAAVVQVPIVERLAASFGWINSVRITGSLLLLIAIVGLLAMPAVQRPPHGDDGQALAQPLRLLARPRIWTAFLMECAATPVGGYAFAALVVYARDSGITVTLATAAIVAIAVANTAGRLGGGVVSDRFGVDRVVLAILLIDVFAAILLARTPTPAFLMIAAIATGIGFGGAAGVMSRLAVEGAPDAPNSAFGLLFAGFACGTFTAPLLGAAVGSGGRAWLVVGAFPLLGLAVLGGRQTLKRK